MRVSPLELRASIGTAIDGRGRWGSDDPCRQERGNVGSGRVKVILWLDLPLRLKLDRRCRRSWQRVRTR
jgi:hypothetical protein